MQRFCMALKLFFARAFDDRDFSFVPLIRERERDRQTERDGQTDRRRDGRIDGQTDSCI